MSLHLEPNQVQKQKRYEQKSSRYLTWSTPQTSYHFYSLSQESYARLEFAWIQNCQLPIFAKEILIYLLP